MHIECIIILLNAVKKFKRVVFTGKAAQVQLVDVAQVNGSNMWSANICVGDDWGRDDLCSHFSDVTDMVVTILTQLYKFQVAEIVTS